MIMVMLKNEDKVDSMQALIKLTIIQRVGVDVSIMWRIKLHLRLFDPREPSGPSPKKRHCQLLFVLGHFY